ncbi:glycosyltransferase [Flavobacteriales bacterium]|nr:glycosyltransferase [Flavobacteriales bacterium]
MKASILIPAYNAAEFIGETLASCVQQGRDCIEEIIVINDHSEDDTRSVVQRFQAEHADFRIILEDNPTKGACSARNHALRLAQGAAIQWLDADDLLGEGKLEAQLELLQQNPLCLIASKWRRFAGDLTNLWPEEQGAWGHVPDQSSPKDWLLAERMMIPAGWLGSRQLFESIEPWDASLLINQDGEYFTRAIVASAGVILEPESRVYYRSEMQGSVSQFRPNKVPSLFASTESFEQAVLQLGNDSALKTLISNQYMGFIYRVYPLVPELRKKARAKIKHYGKPTRQNDVAESAVAKLLCSIFGWKFFVQLRIIRTRLKP